MNKFSRNVVAYLKGIGATEIDVIHGGKHNKVAFNKGGKVYKIVISCTPSNADNALKAVKGDVAKLLR